MDDTGNAETGKKEIIHIQQARRRLKNPSPIGLLWMTSRTKDLNLRA
jgi:hypothetical protein